MAKSYPEPLEEEPERRLPLLNVYKIIMLYVLVNLVVAFGYDVTHSSFLSKNIMATSIVLHVLPQSTS